MSYKKSNPNGQATMANSEPVVISKPKRIRKTTQVRCSECAIIWDKEMHTLNRWLGRCFECANEIIRSKIPPLTQESKNKIKAKRANQVFSEETRRLWSEQRKGNQINKGRIPSEETRKKMSQSQTGRKHTEETRQLLREQRLGEKGSNWQGGLTDINKTIRASLNYKLWREKVFQRDDYTCQLCNKRGGILNADHIKPFSLFPELRFDINNGRALCLDCHKNTDTYGGKMQRLQNLNNYGI